MVTVIFTKNFATKKKGEEWACDSLLASTLVNEKKVAKYTEAKKAADKKAFEEAAKIAKAIKLQKEKEEKARIAAIKKAKSKKK